MSERPTLNHVAISMDPAVLDDAGRRDVLDFYGEVFGWTARDQDMGGFTYTMFQSPSGTDVGGCMQMMEGTPAPHWLVYIGTDDVDASTARAKELGATVYVEPADIPNVGRFSVIQDPTGAVFGLFKGIPQQS